MKILMIAPNPFFCDRGFAIRIHDQIEGLSKAGHEVRICAYNTGRDVPGMVIRRIPDLPGYGSEQLGASFSRFYLDAFLFFTSLKEAWTFKPDVVHGHLHEGALMGIVIGKLLGIPVLLDSQGSLTGELKDRGHVTGGRLLSWIARLEALIDRKAGFIIYSSPVVGKLLVEEFGMPPEKIRLLEDGIDVERFNPSRDTGPVRKRLGLPEGRTVVVYSGALQEYHGTDCLLNTIRHVVSKTRELHFVIVGYTNLERYRRMAADLGITDCVTFTGRVNFHETPDYLRAADIAVAPKLGGSEANLKLGYYMACGLPVVCFDTEINRKVLGEYAVYVELGNPAALGDGIIGLSRDPARIEAFGRGLRGRAESLFSLDCTTRKLLGVYGALLGHG